MLIMSHWRWKLYCGLSVWGVLRILNKKLFMYKNFREKKFNDFEIWEELLKHGGNHCTWFVIFFYRLLRVNMWSMHACIWSSFLGLKYCMLYSIKLTSYRLQLITPVLKCPFHNYHEYPSFSKIEILKWNLTLKYWHTVCTSNLIWINSGYEWVTWLHNQVSSINTVSSKKAVYCSLPCGYNTKMV